MPPGRVIRNKAELHRQVNYCQSMTVLVSFVLVLY